MEVALWTPLRAGRSSLHVKVTASVEDCCVVCESKPRQRTGYIQLHVLVCLMLVFQKYVTARSSGHRGCPFVQKASIYGVSAVGVAAVSTLPRWFCSCFHVELGTPRCPEAHKQVCSTTFKMRRTTSIHEDSNKPATAVAEQSLFHVVSAMSATSTSLP